jgi:hypothetical protein
MHDVVQIGDVEVPRSTLLTAGGPLPSTWHGQALKPVAHPESQAADGAFPETGWRVIASGRRSTNGVDQLPVLAAPAESLSHWWLVYLYERDGSWEVLADPHPVPERPRRAVRAQGLHLAWPQDHMTATPHGLRTVVVELSRNNSSSLAWDEEDSRHVVGWLCDLKTGDPLPYEPAQAFAGYGAVVGPEVGRCVRLPVRWITRDLNRVSPGLYGVTAALTALDVHTDMAQLNLID